MEPDPALLPPLRLRRAITGILGALGLGVLGNALWETAVKPSGAFLIQVATLGSARLRDSIYEQAATEPLPLASLHLLALANAALIAVVLIVLGVRAAKRLGIGMTPSGGRIVNYWALLAMIASATGINAQAAMLNESVLVWREFNSNMAVLAPYMSVQQQVLLRSRFAQIRKRSEYEALRAEMRQEAAISKVRYVDLSGD